jgi:ABC-2 type transport system ATP-binding protein
MTSHSSVVVEVQDLSRIYHTTIGVIRRKRRQVQALDRLTFSVRSGELFGVVGPNGAGKTTLIKILCTQLLPSSGEAYVLGFNVATEEKPIRSLINVVLGGERGLYTRLSGEDNLKYFADLYRVPRHVAAKRIPYLLGLVGLSGREKERVEGYSRGMKQRLHIAKSLINDPRVLFLDEPTIGLDPDASRKLRDIVRRLHDSGTTIILTSHNMFEVDELCNCVAIINEGQIITIDSPYNLKRYVSGMFVVEAQVIHGYFHDSIVADIKAFDSVENVTLSNSAHVQTLTIQTSTPDALHTFLQERIPTEHLQAIFTREPTLEDAYLKLV